MSSPGAVPGWMDDALMQAMRGSDDDVGQHSQWWRGMNNGMSKSWLMQDGHDPGNTRYTPVDGAPWSFVYECKESSLPQEALDAVYLFSPHSMLNLRGAMVPTKALVPRIEAIDMRRWKIVGVWKKRDVERDPGVNNGDPPPSDSSSSEDEGGSDSDDDGRQRMMERLRSRAQRRAGSGGGGGTASGGRGGIHDLDLDSGMPALGGNAEGTDLENVSPVRIEAWMTKVFHYPEGHSITGDKTVRRKMFCILTVTPVRNFNMAEYLRQTIVENVQGSQFPGMSQSASETMRKDKKDMLHRLLLGQMDLCGFLANTTGAATGRSAGCPPDPLDALNMPSTDYYPANYLSVPMAYRRIQYAMRKQGFDHRSIYVEGFSDTVSMFTVSDLRLVKEHNNAWAPSFYSAVGEFEALKPEERADYRARLQDSCPPSWARHGEESINRRLRENRRQQPRAGGDHLVDDEADEDDDVEHTGLGGGGDDLDALYAQKNRMPPIKICLWYNPLMYISPSATRSEWEQQLGGFPAFFIYTMSRSIYSSATNPLLKPEYFMPEAKPMSTHARWHEHMDDGDNPFAGYCVAGWACRQFQRVMDASRLAVNVTEVCKVQMVLDYMQTCFNMHLGLIDTKSLRSKTVYWAHRLMRECDSTVHHDLVEFLRSDMRLGTDTALVSSSKSHSGRHLADGGYAQVSYLHVESLNVLNRDHFHLNDLNLSLLWRMLVTTTHHCVGMNNGDLSAMGSSIVACRGAGHYTGRFAAGNANTNNGVANTYQALDKPNSVGGDYVVSHHSWMKSLGSNLSSSVRAFDNGQVPSDMTRFTEASMRMIGTVLVDERNNVRKEPMDNLLSQYYQTEMQITNVDQLKSLVMLLPRNMKQGSRGLAVDMSSADTEKTGERTITKRLGVPGYLPHIVVVMTNMRAQLPEIKERLETAVIVMQRTFCGGPVDLSVGLYSCLSDHRKHGFAQYTWNAEKALGSFPKETKSVSALYCTAYTASAYYAMLANKHGMYSMELSTLCKGLCRWIESICGQYLSHIYGKRQARDVSRTLEVFKTVAASETSINYTVLMMLRSKTLTAAMPKIMMCSMIDPIHIHEMPRMVYNFILNSISLPIFFAVSVFQREMEFPALPLESVVELFTNGSRCSCCIRSRAASDDPAAPCSLRDMCHTKRIRDMLVRMMDRRAFLPRDSGMLMRFDTNCMPYITGYGGEDDRCDMSSHAVFGRVRPSSCMRGKPGRGAMGGQQQQQQGHGEEEQQQQQAPGPGSSRSESATAEDACRMFAKQCFNHYSKPFCECAMITEGEFCNSMEEFSRMSTKFAQFFGDMPFFGQHRTVMKNLGVPNVPAAFHDLSHKQVFEQGQPIIRARCFMSGEIGIGIDWMCMLLLLSISGSSRIDQQLGKNVAMNLVAQLFSKVPYTMFPYDAIQIKEFNPHMPSQEIEPLRPAAARNGCILRPNNKYVLDDGVPMKERMLVPSCGLAPGLMMEDIGIASPLYDLCSTLGIDSVYRLPIELVPWPVPYPTGVPWPVVRYGVTAAAAAAVGYIVVAPGGKSRLWIRGRNGDTPYQLASVQDAATAHGMGPRPLFCTPCRGVRLDADHIGVLVPFPHEAGQEVTAYHPGMTPEAYRSHPLRRMYSAQEDSYACWDPRTATVTKVRHSWVEENVLPMCSSVLVRAWAPCMERLLRHISYRGSPTGADDEAIRAGMRADNVHVLGRVVPPRDCCCYGDKAVWVSIEVRHTVGNLKHMPCADMITLKVPVEDLRPMPVVDAAAEGCGPSASRYKRSRGDEGAEDMVVSRFIYASKAPAVPAAGRA